MGETRKTPGPTPHTGDSAASAVSDTGALDLAKGAAAMSTAPPPPAVQTSSAAAASVPGVPADSPRPPLTPPPTPLIGTTVSHYRILERLGGGGMGVVYKAWDHRLERYAALKFLSPHRSGSDDFKRRFSREARTASRLEHSSICTVFECDETEDGRLFIAMAFCEGESLKRKIERGPLPLPQALAIGAQIAAGLAAAHDKGIVHRDVKPGNIMVAEDGRVKIVDFGIARLADQTRITRTGDVMGTTAYVAPEQFLDEVADHRVDLWALGVVIYEMIAGRLPWSGGDERELVSAIVKRPARPLASLRPGVPPALERVVGRALAKRPAERYQRADELRGDLLSVAELLAQPPTTGTYDQTLVEAPLPATWERAGMAGPPGTGGGAGRGASGDAVGGGGAGGVGGAGAGSGWLERRSGAAGGTGQTAGGSPLPSPAESAAIPPPPAGIAGTGTGAAIATGPLSGRVVHHYRVLGQLGGGGMGVVYKAQDLRLERLVALKFLPHELTLDPDSKTRFLLEARAASALDHPNICTIHEVGETDEGQLYLAMACYEGETLKQRLQRGRLAIDESLEIAQQVARGLVKAHRHGIVHRDIKPANLMITTDEIVKILDFGIAKLAGAAGLTRSGSSLGTPGYMSPEQARGEEVDPRTDVWSLGAVLYEMVTGRRPFRGEHEQTVLYSLFNEEPEPVPTLRPDAPPELVRIIGRLLAKDRERRYPDAAAALADLRALYGPVTGTLTGTSATVTPSPANQAPPGVSRSRGRRTAVLGAAMLVVLLPLAFLWWWRSRPAPPPAAEQARYLPLTADLEGKETFPSISPDGNYFVYAKPSGSESDIYWQRVGGSPLNLTKEAQNDNTQPAISPDGQQIAFRSERAGGGIFLMGTTGESLRRLTDRGYNPTWSPTGTEIVCATEGVDNPLRRNATSKLLLVPVDTGVPRELWAGDAVQPSWSPHGTRIAFWNVTAGSAQRNIWTITASGGDPVRVTDDGHLNWSPTWSPDGKYIYYSSDRSGPLNIWRVPIDEDSGKVLGSPEPLSTPSPSSALISFSKDGRRMVYASDDGKSNLESLQLDASGKPVAGTLAAITHGGGRVQSLSGSPDGQAVVYYAAAPQEDVYLIRVDGSSQVRLTNDPARDRMPRWSADGKRIIFYSNRTGNYEAWSIRPDGAGLEQLTAIGHAPVYDSMFSPDGRRIACNIDSAGAAIIDLAPPLARRVPAPLPRTPEGLVFDVNSWSPDGRWLAGFTRQPGIMLYSTATGSYRRINNHGSFPIWLQDSRRFIYHDGNRLFLFDTVNGNDHELFKAPAGLALSASAAISPDGAKLYVILSSEEGHIWMRTVS
jgi:serine/threonine protein kinase/Tol biopolymer transport system component